VQTSKPIGPSDKPAAFVLDDNPKVCEIICRLLATGGFAPEYFCDAGTCLRRLDTPSARRPEVLILDLALGDSDAVEMIHQLQRLRFGGKVILISMSDLQTLQDVHDVGVAHGLTMLPSIRKPFPFEELEASLRAAPQTAKYLPQDSVRLPPKASVEKALLNGWLELWYQPKFDLKSLSVHSIEALLRMRHPQFGVLSPGSFLPPAGEPVYAPLSKFVVQQAMADWIEHFRELDSPPLIAVNIPLSVLISPGFVDLIRRARPNHTKFPGLIIEATEGELIQNPELAREIAIQLKLYNIRISIDDFGSAYSAFARLRDLPVVEVKIDASFVRGCSSDGAKRTLCQSVVDLAHRFQASACAEGVEDHDDLRTLAELGCDTVQGFLFAKPQPAELSKTMLLRESMEAKAAAGV
jgi:EAL domain-containing protein (putative c-di-GMP-specific phosphodiesterase class I)